MTSPVRAPRPAPRRVAPAAPAPGRRDHLRVVAPPTRARARRQALHRSRTGPVLAVAMVVVFASLMASAGFHGMLVGGQSDLDRMEQQLEQEQATLAREKLALAEMQSPESIAARAKALGMVPAEQQVWVSPGTGADPVVTGADAVAPEVDADAPPDDSSGTSELAGPDIETEAP